MAKNNQLLVNGAKNGMEQFKTEVASALGLQQYDSLDKGELTSRQNGYVGGNMTKKMVYFAEQAINTQGAEVVANSPAVELPERIRKQNEQASTGALPGHIASGEQFATLH
ncbi:Small, acid-soluble spore protein alpha [compost metagenome]